MTKRIFSLILASVLVCTLLVACGGRDNNKDEGSSSQLQGLDAIATELQKEVHFETTFNQLDKEQMSNYFMSMNLADLSDYKVLVSADGGFADEIGLFKATNSDSAKRIRQSIDERIEDLTVSFENYKPEEMEKINNAVIIQNGDTIYYCVTSDYTKAKTVLSKSN